MRVAFAATIWRRLHRQGAQRLPRAANPRPRAPTAQHLGTVGKRERAQYSRLDRATGQPALPDKGRRVQRAASHSRRTPATEGRRGPRLLRPVKRAATAKSRAVAGPDSWEGVDQGLFEELRRLRREKAAAQDMPPYIVFGDAALRDMARRRPSTLDGFRQVKGVGEKKLADYGQAFVSRMVDYCRANQTAMDVQPSPPTAPAQPRRPRPPRPALPPPRPTPSSSFVRVSA